MDRDELLARLKLLQEILSYMEEMAATPDWESCQVQIQEIVLKLRGHEKALQMRLEHEFKDFTDA